MISRCGSLTIVIEDYIAARDHLFIMDDLKYKLSNLHIFYPSAIGKHVIDNGVVNSWQRFVL